MQSQQEAVSLVRNWSMLYANTFEDYQVNQNGVIQSPGKFEGEYFLTPLFYQAWNEG